MKIVLFILMSVMCMASNGQTDSGNPVGTKQPEIPLKFEQKEFGERFTVLYYSEGDYDYYVIDMTKLGDRFERIYFINLTFEDSILINLEADIEKDQMWFKAYHQYKDTEITCIFRDLKDKADKAAREMSATEKSAWMAKNDKYSKNNSHE